MELWIVGDSFDSSPALLLRQNTLGQLLQVAA